MPDAVVALQIAKAGTMVWPKRPQQQSRIIRHVLTDDLSPAGLTRQFSEFIVQGAHQVQISARVLGVAEREDSRLPGQFHENIT